MMRFYALLMITAVLPVSAFAANATSPHPQITDETVLQGSDVTAPIPLKQDELAVNGLGPAGKTLNLAAVEPAAGPAKARTQPPAQAAKTLQDYMFGYSEVVPTSFPKVVDDMEGPARDVQYR